MAWVECWGDDLYECSECGDMWDTFEEARGCCPDRPRNNSSTSKWASKGLKRLRDNNE